MVVGLYHRLCVLLFITLLCIVPFSFAAAAPVPASAPTLTLNIAGPSGSNTPPALDLAVGPEHVVVTSGSVLTVYAKDGTRRNGPVDAAAIFSDSICALGAFDTLAVRYAAQEARWVLLASARDGARGPHYFCLASSRTAEPGDAWITRTVRVDPNAPGFAPTRLSLGLWHDALVISAIIEDVGIDGNRIADRGRVWLLNRDDLFGDALLRRTTLDLPLELVVGGLVAADPEDAPPTGTSALVLASPSPSPTFSQLYRLRINADWNTAKATLVAADPVAIAPWRWPTPVAQPAPATPIAPERGLLSARYVRTGASEQLWVLQPVGTNTGTALRWYALDARPSGLSRPLSQGVLAPSDNAHIGSGALTLDARTNLVLATYSAGPTQPPTLAVIGRRASDTPGLLSAPNPLASSAIPNPTGRWLQAAIRRDSSGCATWLAGPTVTADGWQSTLAVLREPLCLLTDRVWLPVVTR